MRFLTVLFTITLISIPFAAEGKDKVKVKVKDQHAGYFLPADVIVINQYYGQPSLPPGLQKKLMRQGKLPPGWQKRYRPFPALLEAQLPPVCGTCGRGYYDNYAIVYDKKTSIIYDIAQLAADIVR